MAHFARVLWAIAIALAACRRVEEPGAERRSPSAAAALSAAHAVTSSSAPARTPVTPIRLFELASSAYQAQLFADERAVELLTATSAYRLVRGEPPRERKLELGFAATVTRANYVYWAKGALWSVDRFATSPAAPQRIAPVTAQPSRVVSDISDNELAFLERSTDDRHSIAAVIDGRAKRLYSSSGSIDELTLSGRVVFFVERPEATGFRLGRISLDGGDVTFTKPKTGRWPALLRADQRLVYYDGSRREVVALSLDFRQETSLAQDLICSPFAVATHVYCANVEGVLELAPGAPPAPLVTSAGKVVASIAASGNQVAFVTDIGAQGQDRLAVSVVPLTGRAADGL